MPWVTGMIPDDAVGNVTTQTDALYRTSTFSYDAMNRNTVSIDPLSNRTTTAYDAIGNATTVTDALNRVTTVQFDAINRQTVVVEWRERTAPQQRMMLWAT